MTTNVEQAGSAPSAEQSPPPRRAPRRTFDRGRLFESSMLPLAWAAVIVGFGIARPDTFLQWSNFTSIFGTNSVQFVLVMALLLPLTNGDLDMSVAENAGLVAILVAWLNVNHHWGIVPAIILGIVVGTSCGAINGLIVTRFDVNPFIITLATGTVMDGVSQWLPNQLTISGISTKLGEWTFSRHILSIPIEFWYGIVIMLIMWYVLTFTPFGQRALFVGQSREVARLSGFRVNSTRFWGFVLAGLIASIAGVLNDGTLGSATPGGTASMLLGVFAAAFLGLTTIQPGRFNAVGAGISIFFLATGVNGMNLLGASSYVQSLFDGVVLVIAVVASRVINRRRALAAAAAANT